MTPVVQAAAGGAAGFVAGTLFFLALRHNAALYLADGPAWQPVALHLARMVLLAGLLVGVVLVAGGAGLLAALAGILLARAIALRLGRAGA